MSDTILLLAPVAAEDLAEARRRFPTYSWRQTAGAESAEAIRTATIVFGKPDNALLAQARSLRWLQGTSAGMEQLAGDPIFRRAAWTLTTASGMHESCVEHGIALLLAVSRRIGAHTRSQESKRWNSRGEVPTALVLSGKTLGVLGLGAIGRRISAIARAIGMRTIGFNFHGVAVAEADETYAVSDLDRHLPRLDALLLVLPATPATDHLLSAARLARLPRHCLVVNVGRGNAIDEVALIAALREERLGGAGLDVFRQEPLPDDSPFYQLPNVVITPHIGGNRPDYDQQAFAVFLDNLVRFAAGVPLRNVVERDRGY